MKIINSRIHGVLDFVVVALFLLAPTLIPLQGTPAVLSYSLAGIHLVVTLLTDFPLGVLKVIPFPIHGWIELLVAPSLIGFPWVFAFSENTNATVFYVGSGALIFVVWLLTDYRRAMNAGSTSNRS